MSARLIRHLLCMACCVRSLFATTSPNPPTFVANENNVAGSMPNPSGNPRNGVILVGTMHQANACMAAASKFSNATSWTYHHCDFPPAVSGNYSCHCYARTDGHWDPTHENLIDSGFLKSVPKFRCDTARDCQLNVCEISFFICIHGV